VKNYQNKVAKTVFILIGDARLFTLQRSGRLKREGEK